MEPTTQNEEVITKQTERPWWMPEAFQQTVELADGTILNGYAGLNTVEDDLWVMLENGISVGQASLIFDDPEKTKKIISHLSKLETQEYEGYTVLHTIKNNGENRISIRMKKAR